MTTLLELHLQHFSHRTGTFNHKAFAAIAAERMRGMLSRHAGVHDSRAVQVVGKGTSFTIEFPRIRHVWWPKFASAESIGGEMAEVLHLFKQETTK